MSAEKRRGDESLGASLVVKRQKSATDVAVVNGNTQGGAIIQQVCGASVFKLACYGAKTERRATAC
jgi:hypothetical protein